MAVRLRFACDPKKAGQFESVRLAILNWLFCRHQGGTFLVRVDCDEPAAVEPAAVQKMFRLLDWLGLKPGGKPAFQSLRSARYYSAAESLLSAGVAFQDPMAKGAIAFRASRHNTTFSDMIGGTVSREASEARDLLIVRADGSVTPSFMEVVDDMEASVTHVIREESDLSNAFVQMDIARALGGSSPLYAHVPSLLDSNGQKLSGRYEEDGAVTALRERGYLASAVFSYLAMLGCRSSEVNEALSTEDMVERFDLARWVQSPPKLDMSRLEWMNGEYMRALSSDDFARGLRHALVRRGVAAASISDEHLGRVVPLVRPWAKTFADLAELAVCFFSDEIEYEPSAVKLHLQGDRNLDTLSEMNTRLAQLSDFSADTVEGALKQVAMSRDVRPSMLTYAVRVAVSGRLMGPDVGSMLALMGRDRVLERLHRTVSRFSEE